jgi:AraC-type DNA-binding domain-containing proteins
MNIVYQHLSESSDFSINTLEVSYPAYNVPLHYHPEIEIIYIDNDTGMKYVGDKSCAFSNKEVSLIGSNLQHVWRSDAFYDTSCKKQSKAYVIHFRKEIFEGGISLMPEIKGIRNLLQEASRGVTFTGSIKTKLVKLIVDIGKQRGIKRFMMLLEILRIMAESQDKTIHSSLGYTLSNESEDSQKFKKIHHFILENFKQKITLEEVAGIANMTPNAFCKFFKKRTAKSFTDFLNGLRIGYACKLILEGKLNIAGICLECGFNNLSNFNMQFKQITGDTPSEYRKKYMRVSDR